MTETKLLLIAMALLAAVAVAPQLRAQTACPTVSLSHWKGTGVYVVAPSLIPRRSGNKVKTDRRDAVELVEQGGEAGAKPPFIPSIVPDGAP